jgi:hypothetical protein
MRTRGIALGMAILAALLAFPGGALAHGAASTHVRPVLGPLPPALAGMRIELRETLGMQLVLENPTARSVEVLDETGVPFLRIGPRGVEANLAAATWYRALGPASAVPASAYEPGARPRWMLARAAPSYGWFDPRLAARLEPPHHPSKDAEFGRWEVPLRVDGESVQLAGRFRAETPATGVYSARLTSPLEIAPGVRVRLLPGRAPGLLVDNQSGLALLVFGVDGEPFLRIGPQSVEANLRSRTWEQSARSASTPPAETQGAAGEASDQPVWKRVASVPRFGWIEPRALVKASPPSPSGSAVPDAVQWSVPMQLADQPLRVTGVVSWTPLAGTSPGSRTDARSARGVPTRTARRE